MVAAAVWGAAHAACRTATSVTTELQGHQQANLSIVLDRCLGWHWGHARWGGGALSTPCEKLLPSSLLLPQDFKELQPLSCASASSSNCAAAHQAVVSSRPTHDAYSWHPPCSAHPPPAALGPRTRQQQQQAATADATSSSCEHVRIGSRPVVFVAGESGRYWEQGETKSSSGLTQPSNTCYTCQSMLIQTVADGSCLPGCCCKGFAAEGDQQGWVMHTQSAVDGAVWLV